METVTRLVSAPETLVVSGCSGGGFGAALLTDDVLNLYPNCENVTCLVDSAFIPMDDWHDVAENVWCAPQKIAKRIHTNNITLDALQALHRERGDQFQAWLAAMMAQARDTLPGVGLYLFHIPDKQQKKNDLTIHCIIGKRRSMSIK